MARKRKTPLGSEAAAAPPPLPEPTPAARSVAEVEPAFTLVRSEEAPGQLVLTLVLPGVEGVSARCLLAPCSPSPADVVELASALSFTEEGVLLHLAGRFHL